MDGNFSSDLVFTIPAVLGGTKDNPHNFILHYLQVSDSLHCNKCNAW